MQSNKQFVGYNSEQLELSGVITKKPMMGEYLLYCDGVYVALVSDNQLFVNPTDSGRTFIGNPDERPAYPGAKPSFFIESKFEDKKWIAELIRLTRDELSKSIKPVRKSKTVKKKK